MDWIRIRFPNEKTKTIKMAPSGNFNTVYLDKGGNVLHAQIAKK